MNWSWPRFIAGTGGVVMTIAALGYGCGTSRPATLDEPTVGRGPALYGPCAPEGATRTCDVEIARHNGVLDCFSGTQTCTDHAWSICGGTNGTITSRNFSGGELGTSTLPKGFVVPLSLSGADGGGAQPAPDGGDGGGGRACSTDPCNPACWGYDEDAGTVYPTEASVTFSTGVGSIGSAPAGRGPVKDNPAACHLSNVAPPSAVASSCNPNGTNSTTTNCDNCDYDMYCASAGAACVPYAANQTRPQPADCTVGKKVDLTVEYPCHDSAPPSDWHFPVCNRGTDSANAGIMTISVDTGGSGTDFGKCAAGGGRPTAGMAATAIVCSAAAITVNLATHPIAPGKCLDITPSIVASDTFTGSAAAMGVGKNVSINCDSNISECNVCNNWNLWDSKSVCATTSVPGYTATPYTQYYNATCPMGTHVQWGLFAYKTTLPTDVSGSSSVVFSMQTTSNPDGGGYTPAVVVATAGTTDPAVCAMGPAPDSGTSGCPKDLYYDFNGFSSAMPPGPMVTNQYLLMTAMLTPTPDGLLAPALNSWQITYSCLPSE